MKQLHPRYAELIARTSPCILAIRKSKEFRSLVSRVIKKPARPAQTDNEEGTGLEVQQPFLPLIPCRPFRRFHHPIPNGFLSSSNCSFRACRREEKTETERQKGKEGRKKNESTKWGKGGTEGGKGKGRVDLFIIAKRSPLEQSGVF